MLSEIRKLMGVLVHTGGFLGSCLVNANTGVCVLKDEDTDAGLDQTAVLAAEMLRVQKKNAGAPDHIEDILITRDKQYHLIHPLRQRPDLFLFLMLERRYANLSYARLALAETEQGCATLSETTELNGARS